MSWNIMPKWRPHMGLHYTWLNRLCDNIQYLYDNYFSRSIAIPEPARLDSDPDDSATQGKDWDYTWFWDEVDSVTSEYAFVYQPDKPWLWYRYPIEKEKDEPALTYGWPSWGSARGEDQTSLNTDNGPDEWNVQDLREIADLVPGMVVSVHSVRCALIRNVSE